MIELYNSIESLVRQSVDPSGIAIVTYDTNTRTLKVTRTPELVVIEDEDILISSTTTMAPRS